MMNRLTLTKRTALLLSCLILSLGLITAAQATTEQFVVYPSKTATVVFKLENGSITIEAGSTVSGKAQTLPFGSLDRDIVFYVTGTTNTTVAYYGNITNIEFSFVSSETGNYTAHFDNTDGTFYKSVDLDYSITPPIFGMSQALFQLILTITTIAIIAVAIVVVTVYIVLRRRRRPKQPMKK